MRSSTQAFLCVHSEQRGCSQTLLSRQGQLHGAVIHMLYSDYNCVVECYFLMYDWEGFFFSFRHFSSGALLESWEEHQH